MSFQAHLRYDNFQRYLSAKRSVDDHALNAGVWQTLQDEILAYVAASSGQPLHILEIGAGTGAMFERMCLCQRAPAYHYVAIDAEAENIRNALDRLPEWARQHGREVTPSNHQVNRLRFRNIHSDCTTQLDATAVDLFVFLQEPTHIEEYDLLIAHAFLDLVDVQMVMPHLVRLLKPGGLAYFPINFDGATILQPEIDPTFDALVEKRYHVTMDERIVNGRPSGDSQTGRHLFGHLQQAALQILNAGSSDWVVFAHTDNIGEHSYRADEAYFLHFIIDTMRGALAQDSMIDQQRFSDWIEERHRQIERGELVYIAHQIDFVAKRM